MSSFGTKSQKKMFKQRSSSVTINRELKRKRSDSPPSTRHNSTHINQTNVSSNKAVSTLNLSSKQDGYMRTTTKTVREKTTVSQRLNIKTLPNIFQSVAPPVAPRTNVSSKIKLEQAPIPKERQSIKQLTVIPSVNESEKLVLPKLKTTNQNSSDQKILQIQNDNQSTPHIPGLCGLINIGNTCFMNSALQCLSNIPELTQWAKDQNHDSLTQNKDIIYAYTSLIKSMWSGENSSVNPQDIKQIISYSAPIFADYGQKDSHEFMNSLLNAFERTNSTSIITDLFYIYTQSQVTCTECNFKDITDETTTFLPLSLPKKTSYNKEILLEDLINDYCLEDDLDGLYYCHSCQNYTQAKQKTNINLCLPLPSVLIIQLKRFPFDDTYQKIDTFVRYKLQYCNLLSQNDMYQLCAVSSHNGSLASGHYTTLARNNDTKQWYQFNDSYVNKIDSNSIVTRNAYVLIYLKSERSNSSTLL